MIPPLALDSANIRRNNLPAGSYGRAKTRLLRNAEISQARNQARQANAAAQGAATVAAATGLPVTATTATPCS